MEENPGSVKLSSYFAYFLGPKGRVAVSGIMVLVILIFWGQMETNKRLEVRIQWLLYVRIFL